MISYFRSLFTQRSLQNSSSSTSAPSSVETRASAVQQPGLRADQNVRTGEDAWTLERVKDRISIGARLTHCVVDIGLDILVKYGTHISVKEGEATQFVAEWTSVRVPKIYAILHDETTKITYIVQEKLPGSSLMDHLPTLDAATCSSLADELKNILHELTKLDARGAMGLFGRPSKYDKGILQKFSAHDPGVEIRSTIEFVEWIPKQLRDICDIDKMPSPDVFDFSCGPIFSHGDLVPENILIIDGHVSGIIDWDCAGWYPYFWNDYIGRWRRKMPAFRDGKWMGMMDKMTTPFSSEVEVFDDFYSCADRYL
ncbi:kinase-like domain-containing protein [Mycena pura]|uniref:Kinase-like domain-containing protein n=1 Tax=Mycena pura TaxID=153505 RepID=A0AAD6V9I1_9AGAR|nr:kinase-like domain-containing protein [Mycena pura]